ncbi:MAG: peptide-N4-asparagine amidase [Steroidobacteraceae bacterium]
MNTITGTSLAAILLGISLSLSPQFAAAQWQRGSAQDLNIPPPPAIGQQNVATADLLVSHPATKPCIVTLFQSDTFDDYSPRPFSYAPPANCPGPWAKVVFIAHFNENSGVQYDRTAYVFLGNANLYFGTTPEPTATLGPSWTVQSDVTAYSALLAAPRTGAVSIFNIVNSTYTGVIHGSGFLYFYPFENHHGQGNQNQSGDQAQQSDYGHGGEVPGQSVPSAVYSLNSGNQPTYLDTPSDQLSQQFVFPKNMTGIDLVIVAQSQIGDEFWYTCVPNQYAGELQSCGNTGYRQVVVQVDGRTVAYAPVSPWIYTGGIDPFLWAPTPGAQTLNFTPYLVDLTPLVAKLDDGQPHTVALSVYNDDNYFSVAASLLVYQDQQVSSISGGVTEISVPALSPAVTSDLSSGTGGSIAGSVNVSSKVHTLIAGYINLPSGPRWTSVEQDFAFANDQDYTINSVVYDQQIALSSTVDTVTRVRGSGAYGRSQEWTGTRTWSFPLTVNYDQVLQSNGNYDITTTVLQDYRSFSAPLPTAAVARALMDRVQAEDTLELTPSFNIIGNANMTSSQQFEFQSRGSAQPQCYNRTITNAASSVSAVSDARRCELLSWQEGGR